MSMSILILKENDTFDEVSGFHYNLISSVKNTLDEHSHDFFEIFLISSGRAVHIVNGARQYLSEGSLVFIRPQDIHFYEKDYEWDCQLINIAFSKNNCEKLFDYLDNSYMSNILMSPKYPVYIELTQLVKYNLLSRFENLYTLSHSDKHMINLELKGFIIELISCFFGMLYKKPENNLPLWLDTLITEMQQRENFTAGLPKMLELSSKTQEHICRELKRYLNKTPTELINENRLNYSKNLLQNTDTSISDICFDSGFENLSHFYHLFKKQFGTSPVSFRKKHQKNII